VSDKNRLDYLDVLRGIGIILVVGIHAHGYGFPDGGMGQTSFEHVFEQLTRIAVPIFFLCDGFLMARNQCKLLPNGFRDILHKSVHRLLIPWVIFNVVYLIFRAVFEQRGLLDKKLIIVQPFIEILKNLYYSRIAMQLYFLPTLFLMRLLVVPLRAVWRRSVLWSAGIWLGYIVAIRLLNVRLSDDPLSQAVIGFQYFLIGAVFFKLESMSGSPRRWILPLFVFGLIALSQPFTPVAERFEWLSARLVQYGLLTLAYLGCRTLPTSPAAALWLGRHTMEIYLLHAPILLKITQMIILKTISTPLYRFQAIWALDLLITVVFTMLLVRIPGSKRLFGAT
jgi:fucose 4-O-acetylase-like acetyltransferase